STNDQSAENPVAQTTLVIPAGAGSTVQGHRMLPPGPRQTRGAAAAAAAPAAPPDARICDVDPL
ncbi:hypothetical protein ACIKT0_14590, partial [Hansschlegelia beijingensis]|uniref:hypothetical protein n=1 Tax=Hansschlegelia beijingensis TaxID=1133344 RepID=UPI00387EF623